MRIQLASDLHTEMHRDGGMTIFNEILTDADVLVLAGDIGCAKFPEDLQAAIGIAAEHYAHVIYVPGNHEYYGSSPEETRKLLKALPFENVHTPENEAVTIAGQRFLCGTGWFLPSLNESAQRHMNDFFQIRNFQPWVYEQNLAFRKALCSVEETDIVVTHHLPTDASISPRFVGSALNDFFVSDFDEFMGIPKLWLHGHTHDRKDYRVGNTRVVCNPLGYPTERTSFDPGLIIEVE